MCLLIAPSISTSCTSDLDSYVPIEVELEIFVSETLSGNPRQGISVAIYHTEDDAKRRRNTIVSSSTNDDGITSLDNIWKQGKDTWLESILYF